MRIIGREEQEGQEFHLYTTEFAFLEVSRSQNGLYQSLG
jgi:hypothetical protein